MREIKMKNESSKQAQKQALRKTDVSSFFNYHIETKDGCGSFNFFTQAKDHKKALRQLETNSSDYNRIVKADRDLVITIKKIQ